MDLSERIKESLESTFKFGFKVTRNHIRNNDKYLITPFENELELFSIEVEIRNDVRITIVSKPARYGASFLKAISDSNQEQRGIFIKYWESFTKRNCEISVKINGVSVSREEFLLRESNWNSFSIRFTKLSDFELLNDKGIKYLEYINSICAMQLTLLDYEVIYPNEATLSENGYVEGNLKSIKGKRYERDPRNRTLCLMEKGYDCAVCGFNFSEKYGDIGREYIEVHHIIPVSQMGPGYLVNPLKDLVPLCSNCHSMIHKKNPPYTVNELRAKIIK